MTTPTIRLGLVDDHILLRRGIAEWLEASGFHVVVQADNGQKLIEQLNEHLLPEVMLVDVNMPVMNGIDTTRWLRRHHPGIRILAMSVDDSDEVMSSMLRSGAAGYVLKDSRPDELVSAVQAVHEKNFYRSRSTTEVLLDPAEPTP